MLMAILDELGIHGGELVGLPVQGCLQVAGRIADPVHSPEVSGRVNSIEENTASVDGNVKPGTVGQDSDPESPSAQLVVTGIRTGTEAEGGAMTAVATGTTGGTGTEIPGRYGTLKIGADGSYVYTLDNGNPKVNFLREGQNLTETFSYTLADPEGKIGRAHV